MDNKVNTFIVSEDTPIIKLKGSEYTIDSKKLKKGTVINGSLRTKVVSSKNSGNKRPFSLIQIEKGKEKEYVIPSSVNLYLSELNRMDKSQFTGGGNDPSVEGDSGVGTMESKSMKRKSTAINVCASAIGAYSGYLLSNKFNLSGNKKYLAIGGLAVLGFCFTRIVSKISNR